MRFRFYTVIALSLILASPVTVAKTQKYQATSADHRTAMLELYTSEGCSSCPPAEHWIRRLKGLNGVVPLEFHVTYWNQGGWKDPFSNIRYDNRQHTIELNNVSATLYTPQFVLDGKDLRGGSDLRKLVARINSEPAPVDLNMSALVHSRRVNVTMKVDCKNLLSKDVELYLVVYENNLVSHVTAGENKGMVLKHDFVVRHLYGPFTQLELKKKWSVEQSVKLLKKWKRNDLNLVLFAENPFSGEVLQVVKLALAP